MSPRDSLKQSLSPLRRAAGRFVVSPLEQRVADLEANVFEIQLTNAILYKAAAFIAADKLDGDYLEFGVFTGGSFMTAFRSIEEAFKRASTPNKWNTSEDCIERNALWEKMRFFAFDSFQGLPELSHIDSLSQDFVKGKFTCSEEEFLRTISSQGLPLDRVSTVAGWFSDTLLPIAREKHNIRKAAIVYIDSDLYESAKIVLNFITPLLVTGSVLIFDDWYNYRGDSSLGEQRACREWLEDNPDIQLLQYHREGPWKNSFIVKRQ